MPELSVAKFRVLGEGWDSLAIEADGRLVFKFPKNVGAERALRREAALLRLIRPQVALPVPDMRLLGHGEVFSCHAKLAGEHLTSADYAGMSLSGRAETARRLGQFYAQLHALDMEKMTDAGALAVGDWLNPDAIRHCVRLALSDDLQSFALRLADAFEALPPDPAGLTYGYFDGHGWNMAFDHQNQCLNGVYDFADSGIGPLHREFACSSFVARDLTLGIVAEYQRLTGRTLDQQRIDLLTGYLRLSEWTSAVNSGGEVDAMHANLSLWAEATRGLYRWSDR